MPELAPLLKRLRLSGILDSLETRNREAVANKIPYTDFLALLIADEVARREHKKFNLRIRRAGFRSSKTLEQFDFDFNAAINQTLITDLATCGFVAEKVAVLIAGPCGTGKSHIAQALGHAAVRADYDALFTTQSQLLASLHAVRAINAYERRFHTFARVPLLVIDDFGLKPLRAPQDEDFHDLVAERYEQGATIIYVIWNITSGGLWHALPTGRVPQSQAERWAKGGEVGSQNRPHSRPRQSEPGS